MNNDPMGLMDVRCTRCRGLTQVVGCRWCATCWYPGIDRDYQKLQDLLEEGYTRYQALVMVGWSEPSR